MIVGAAVIAMLNRGGNGNTIVSVTERPLTANPTELPVYAASISADGQFLAYSDATGFYIRLLETGETNPLKLPPGFCFR